MHEIEVINAALGLLKAPRITALDESSELAVLCRLQYATNRDALLTCHPWNFATVRVNLAQSTTTPATDWSYQYPVPNNPYCLQVRATFPDYIEWEMGYDPIDGRVVLTDTETLAIRYTARIEDLNIWNHLAVKALQYWLAADLAMPITGSESKAELWLKAYVTQKTEAITNDSREGSPTIARAPVTLTEIR